MSELTGTGKLIRLALRRDRMLLPIWVLFPVVVPVVFVAAFNGAYPTPQALQEYAETSAHNAAFTVMYGALHGGSLGQLIAWRSGFVPVIVGLLSVLTVIRHTRAEEEAGRRELIGSTAAGRHAGLAAALIVTGGADLVMGVLSALALIGQGLPAAGSLAYGIGLVVTGWVFTATGAVVAQLTTGAGSARGLGSVVLGVAFLLRGIGDVSASGGGGLGWVSWLSPIGWAGQLRPFSGERWWVLGLAVSAVVALTAAAVALSERRDVGSGLFHSRSGVAEAAPGLRTPLALAWRLHRDSLVARAVGFAVVGLCLGGIATSIGELMNNSTPAAREVLARLGGPGTVVDQYFVGVMTMIGVACAAFGIQAALRLRAEESGGRAEPLLAAPVDRLRWASGHFAFALLGSALWLAVFGLAAGLAHGLNTSHIGRELPRVLGAAVVQLPAVWVFVGLAFALFGLLPRLAAGAFAVLMVSLLLGWLGGELQLSQWVLDLSVFNHIPQLPGGDVAVLPLVVLTAIAAALTVLGLLGLRRRDVPAG
ncbi:ABC transporter permease [Saccharopolyspora sp. K220]|uniref:ABC transporter permease n=1 Tax=Saccharopolyspora soli TaxID=2926618 RepID=UPI001F5743CD|nr:ABC transporter permease [Saccharopolyspora soli]MCI2417988.1 ABC transporter permease [Saccharopolyspora soli]